MKIIKGIIWGVVRCPLVGVISAGLFGGFFAGFGGFSDNLKVFFFINIKQKKIFVKTGVYSSILLKRLNLITGVKDFPQEP